MVLGIDPQVMQALTLLRSGDVDAQVPSVGDVAGRRLNTRRLVERLMAGRQPVAAIDVQRHQLKTPDGAILAMSWYRRAMALRRVAQCSTCTAAA